MHRGPLHGAREVSRQDERFHRAAEGLDRRPRPVGGQFEQRGRPGEALAPEGELALEPLARQLLRY
jgi:hypothetical protein